MGSQNTFTSVQKLARNQKTRAIKAKKEGKELTEKEKKEQERSLYQAFMNACGVSRDTSQGRNERGQYETDINMGKALANAGINARLSDALYSAPRPTVYKYGLPALLPARNTGWMLALEIQETALSMADSPAVEEANALLARLDAEETDARNRALLEYWVEARDHHREQRAELDAIEEEEGFLLTPWVPHSEYEAWLDTLWAHEFMDAQCAE